MVILHLVWMFLKLRGRGIISLFIVCNFVNMSLGNFSMYDSHILGRYLFNRILHGDPRIPDV